MQASSNNAHRRVGLRILALAIAIVAWPFGASLAASGWTLDPSSSVLTYQSVKKNTIVETNQIRNISGSLSSGGDVKVDFDLNSVDTGVDLRNVRMRFLFFETFKFPKATVTAKVDPATFADLAQKRRMTAKLPFRLNLHGVDKDYEAEIVVTMITDDSVSIASKAPVAVHADDFGLLPNIEKLQQAANVTNIVPTASVSFDFIYVRDGGAVSPAPVAASGTAQTETASAAGPVVTDAAKSSYSDEECRNRFEVLSRTGAIYFRSGSARLDPASRPVLDTVVESVGKCLAFKLAIEAYTDSDGSDAKNLELSERRAGSVATFIRDAGIPPGRISSAGHGEANPVAANDTASHKALNRRIEFSASLITN